MLGADLNQYNNLQVLEAKSPSELAEKLREIRFPIRILGFDNDGKKFFVYLNVDGKRRIKK